MMCDERGSASQAHHDSSQQTCKKQVSGAYAIHPKSENFIQLFYIQTVNIRLVDMPAFYI